MIIGVVVFLFVELKALSDSTELLRERVELYTRIVEIQGGIIVDLGNYHRKKMTIEKVK